VHRSHCEEARGCLAIISVAKHIYPSPWLAHRVRDGLQEAIHLVIEANKVVMEDGAWYAEARRALRRNAGAGSFSSLRQTASRMSEHLSALSKREGGFKEIFYTARKLRFHALFFAQPRKWAWPWPCVKQKASSKCAGMARADHSLRNERCLDRSLQLTHMKLRRTRKRTPEGFSREEKVRIEPHKSVGPIWFGMSRDRSGAHA
jgi:hypothetical protein